MDNRKRHKHSRSHDLPRSSRVNEKIMEYCSKFGRDRDLEKFMRLYSPSSSCTHHSGRSYTTTSTGSTASSMDGYGSDMRCLFLLQDSATTTTTKTTTTTSSESQQAAAAKEHIIPIRMEGEEEDENKAPEAVAAENENTPTKTHESGAKPIRTPDSIAKTHKRLEWDSLADVGYKKSMSTSNISILERSLLREFFQETEKLQKSSNASEGDLKQLQAELLQERTLGAAPTQKPLELKHSSTPPLASSTMVVEATSIRPTKSSSSNSIGRTQQRTQSTSTSTSLLSRRHSEKYAQTTASRRASCISQEVQVSMSSAAATPSLIGSSATPSSFEVYSSRSSRSTTTAASHSNDDAADFQISRRHRRSQPHSSANSNSHSHSEPPPSLPPPHPFVAGITEMLAEKRRLALVESVNNTENGAKADDPLQQLHDTLRSALEENKENASSSSSSFVRSPQLDLGIQLLCSLIEAKSLNAKQKKKLVRDIVKRISLMSDGGGAEEGIKKDLTMAAAKFAKPLASLGSSRSTSSGLKADDYTRDKNSLPARTSSSKTNTAERASGALRNLLPPAESSTEITDGKLLGIDVFKRPSLPTTSAKALAKLSAESSASKSRKSQSQDASDTSKRNATPQVQPAAPPTTSKNIVPKVTTSKNERDKIDKASQIKMPHEDATATTNTITTATTTTNRKTTATTMTPTDKSSNLSAHSTTASTSTSKDLTTQKAANEPHQSSGNTIDDAEQASMREWLNPLTQSEIEYEEKKRELAKKSTRREKIVSKSSDLGTKSSSKSDSERDVQLNWIDSEIVRLESLRHLLLKEDDSDTTAAGVAVVAAAVFVTSPIKSRRRRQPHASAERQIKTTEKLYDTVASEQDSSPSVLSESAERLVQEIEVIIEESNEDIINLDDNLKRTKERKRETHIIYDKPSASDEHGGLALGQPCFRTVKETIVRSEEQVLPAYGVAKAQRSKIDTPTTSYGGSNDTESVGSFVQQRKREFLEHYKQKKKNHYEALQQKEEQMRRDQQRQQRSSSTGALLQQQTTSSHYSVPQTMQRTHHHQHLYNNQAAPQPPPLPPHGHTQRFTATTAVQTSSGGGGGGVGAACQQNSSSSGGITQSSSSSMFCISSEVSIPMGSNASRSTTTTTTHQYDDVAAAAAGGFCYGSVAGVGVQTGDSVLRMQPFFGPRPYDPFSCWRRPAPPIYMRPCGTTTACVQVKPKAIAYVIQFDGKTSSSEASSGTTKAVDSDDGGGVANSEEATPESSGQEPPPPPQLTLQDHLERARPKFLAQVKQRKAILNQLQAVRQEREREMRDIVAADGSNVSLDSLDRKLQRLPPPATKQIRVFATKQMKAMTSKHCATLPEVLAKQAHDREQQLRRGNRILRDVFNRRLQKRVRNGQLDLNHSKTVI